MTAKADAKTKTCSGCGKRKPLRSFGKNAAHKDGLQSDCRECKRLREAGYRRGKAAAAAEAATRTKAA